MTDDFWDWDDRPIQERGAARQILESASFEVSVFKSREDDPPDCEGTLDGQWSAIEVTRLTHEKARAQNMKVQKRRAAGHEPEKPEVFFYWERDDLLRELQKRIDEKEKSVKRYRGGPYDRYVLVFHTDEFVLVKDTVRKFLEGATFRTQLFTDVVLGLSYEPGGYPTFRLKLRHS
jgi:hypothetical protein